MQPGPDQPEDRVRVAGPLSAVWWLPLVVALVGCQGLDLSQISWSNPPGLALAGPPATTAPATTTTAATAAPPVATPPATTTAATIAEKPPLATEPATAGPSTPAVTDAAATRVPLLEQELAEIFRQGKWTCLSPRDVVRLTGPQWRAGSGTWPDLWTFQPSAEPVIRGQSAEAVLSTSGQRPLGSFRHEPPRVTPIVQSSDRLMAPNRALESQLQAALERTRALDTAGDAPVATSTTATPSATSTDNHDAPPASPTKTAPGATTSSPEADVGGDDAEGASADRGTYAWLWDPAAPKPAGLFRQQVLTALAGLATRDEPAVALPAAVLFVRHNRTDVPGITQRLSEWCGAAARLAPSGGTLPRIKVDWQAVAAEAWVQSLWHHEAATRATLDAATGSADSDTNSALLAEDLATARELAAAPAGHLLSHEDLPGEVRRALWWKLSLQIPPVRLPGLSSAAGAPFIKTASADVQARRREHQRAALEACVLHAALRRPDATTFERDRYPVGTWTARLDDDPLTRQLAARWAAWAVHPECVALLRQQSRDSDDGVRSAALASLGCLATPDADAELQRVLTSEGDVRRALAIEALGTRQLGLVLAARQDESPRVRAAVARLCQSPVLDPLLEQQRQATLQALIVDRAPDVQQTVVAVLESCATETAVRPWLAGLQDGTYATRRDVLTQLRRRLGQEADFPVEGSLSERRVALQELAQRFGWTALLPASAPLSSKSLASSTPHPSPVLPAGATQHGLTPAGSPAVDGPAWLTDFLLATDDIARNELLDRLEALGPEGILAIEQALPAREPAEQQRIQREVLIALSPVHRALDELGDTDLQVRRRAAQALDTLANRAAQDPGAVLRAAAHAGTADAWDGIWTAERVATLAERLLHESDRAVWQHCLNAVSRTPLDWQEPLLLLALHHTYADLRLQGLAAIARAPDPRAGLWLLPLLSDASPSVQLAAIDAAGRCGHPVAIEGLQHADPPQPGLRALLSSPSAEVRTATVTALARLHDSAALEELTRMTYAAESSTRLQAVRVMGEAGEPSAIGPLIRLLWTEREATVQQAALTSLEQLVPPEHWPPLLLGADEAPGGASPTLAGSATVRDKMLAWTVWWDQGRPAPTGAVRQTSSLGP